jgi:hypothetical protein
MPVFSVGLILAGCSSSSQPGVASSTTSVTTGSSPSALQVGEALADPLGLTYPVTDLTSVISDEDKVSGVVTYANTGTEEANLTIRTYTGPTAASAHIRQQQEVTAEFSKVPGFVELFEQCGSIVVDDVYIESMNDAAANMALMEKVKELLPTLFGCEGVIQG